MSDRRSPQNDNPLLMAAATILNLGNYSATYGSLTAAIGPIMSMSMSPIMVPCGTVPCGGGGAVTADTLAPAVSTIKRTLAARINIDAKLAALGKARQIVATRFQAKEPRYRGAFRAT
jgi:hypothetical protein